MLVAAGPGGLWIASDQVRCVGADLQPVCMAGVDDRVWAAGGLEVFEIDPQGVVKSTTLAWA